MIQHHQSTIQSTISRLFMNIQHVSPPRHLRNVCWTVPRVPWTGTGRLKWRTCLLWLLDSFNSQIGRSCVREGIFQNGKVFFKMDENPVSFWLFERFSIEKHPYWDLLAVYFPSCQEWAARSVTVKNVFLLNWHIFRKNSKVLKSKYLRV